MFTTSFATGGFAPLLALFDGTGSLLFADSGIADNNCVLNGVDPATGDCYDSRLSWNSIGGAPYIIALTEYDNFALGPTINDGFLEQGNGNFTAAPPFNNPVPGGSFLLPGDIQRTANWSLNFQSADPSLTAIQLTVPEASTAALCLGGFLLLAGFRRIVQPSRRS